VTWSLVTADAYSHGFGVKGTDASGVCALDDRGRVRRALYGLAVTTIVARVEVETQPDGTLLVAWEFEGPPVDVDVAVGATADHVDHRHASTVSASERMVRLAGEAHGRCFVSVAPHNEGPAVVVADRRIAFEGISNFRDLGGYRTAGGGSTRWGLVFRADALHGLSRRDLARYELLGLRAVYDLRSDDERASRPNPMPSHAVSIMKPSEDAAPPIELRTWETTADGEQVLRELYVGLVEHGAVHIGSIFTALAQGDQLPAVFHCHAGKDRTGVVAALLLEALGVARELVLDDYELTTRYRVRTEQEGSYTRLLEMGMSPEAAAGVLTTPRWAMLHALEEVDRRYGGVAPYLTGPAGMRPEALDLLRRRLVDTAG
jgi:protein-tyrosine phosphatase